MPKLVRVYAGNDRKAGKLIGGINDLPDKTGWHEVTITKSSAGASRYFWIEIGPGIGQWMILEEIEFH